MWVGTDVSGGGLAGGRLLLGRVVSRRCRSGGRFTSLSAFFRLFSTNRVLGSCTFDGRRVRDNLANKKGSNNYSATCILLGGRVVASSRVRSLSYPGNSSLRFVVVRSGGALNFNRSTVVG